MTLPNRGAQAWSYLEILYNQRNKEETIVCVIKRLLFGDHITSILVRTQAMHLNDSLQYTQKD
jgi:hypothetical protein